MPVGGGIEGEIVFLREGVKEFERVLSELNMITFRIGGLKGDGAKLRQLGADDSGEGYGKEQEESECDCFHWFAAQKMALRKIVVKDGFWSSCGWWPMKM